MDRHRKINAVYAFNTSSDLPRIAEPLFMEIGVSVDFMPCMNADDFKTVLSGVKQNGLPASLRRLLCETGMPRRREPSVTENYCSA